VTVVDAGAILITCSVINYSTEQMLHLHAQCDMNTKYACILHAELYFVYISHWACRCSICSLEQLITEHVISMAPASITVTQPKLLSFQEKFNVIAVCCRNFDYTFH
jgi:hypothetical protein